jgi:hypothetical protein
MLQHLGAEKVHLKHASSTDDKPQHQDCPTGKTFWSFRQRAVAKILSVPSHVDKSSSFLSEHVVKYVREVYERLTAEALLSRCLKFVCQYLGSLLKTRICWQKESEVGSCSWGSLILEALAQSISLQPLDANKSQKEKRKGNKGDLRRIVQAEWGKCGNKGKMEMASANARAVQELEDKEVGPVYSKGAFFFVF